MNQTTSNEIAKQPHNVNLEAPLVLITGGNGWLGGRVVAAMTEGLADTAAITSGGLKVRALVQAGEETIKLRQLGVEIVSGDIRDKQAQAAFLNNSDGALLIHLAGVIHPQKVAEFEAINARGTIDLIANARQAGVNRAVVMSSNSPIGCNPHPDHRFDETSPYNPYMGYGRSKWMMEVALRQEIAAAGPLEIVILRAPWFYGPNQPPRQTLFFQMVRDGKFPVVGNGTNRRSMGYTDNLAQGILRAAAHPAAAGEIFWIADEIPYTMNEIVETVRAVLRDDFGLKCKEGSLRLPGLISDVAMFGDGMLQTLGIYHQKLHVLSEMNKTIACDISKAKKLIGYAPAVALREGMRRSVGWCLSNGQPI